MHWGLAVFIGFVFAFITLIYLSKRILKIIEPKFAQAQKQAQAKQFKLAIKTLEELLPYTKWQILLKNQIFSQIGVFCFAEKNETKALEYLGKGSPRSPDAQMILATIYYKQKKMDQVKKVFDVTIKFNKKQVILYNAYAYMLNQSGMKEVAIEILQKSLKVNQGNDASKDNLLRLQNNKKMNMKPFGMSWYSLQLEKPPLSMMQPQFAGKAGFRQMRKGR